MGEGDDEVVADEGDGDVAFVLEVAECVCEELGVLAGLFAVLAGRYQDGAWREVNAANLRLCRVGLADDIVHEAGVRGVALP